MSVIPSVVNYLYSLKRRGKSATIEMKVWGNCGKCKVRIEKSLKVKGVTKAKWDINTKMLTITYSPKVISLEKIQEKLALKGHDTEDLYAHKATYNRLPECCKYTRE